MKRILKKAYAKINLHLDVTGKADNGYHEVATVMQSVSLCDEIEVSLSEGDTHSIVCSSPSVPLDSKNLAWRAADLFFDKCGIEDKADIKIIKRIPVAAGLAGGSTDAAAVLSALNELCGEPLSEGELLSLGAKLGADVPFCIEGGTKYADRFGDVLHPFADMPACYIVVACGKEGVSTPWAYAMLDERYNDFRGGAYTPRSADTLERAVESGDVVLTCRNLYNIFESVIEPKRPEVTRIKSLLISFGADGAMMSGSGPSVFGIFRDKNAAVSALNELLEMGIDAFIAEPIG
ncbi:MAG: 4-(cytidine 5'-diphospho)-2-C-methyl-D-erythritol kinase [Clostridia bacterium]|nr:4-(cytidine 5'-diphospho)-2-C-methyl-D-erythritol kinase [Clostridia bacterium]